MTKYKCGCESKGIVLIDKNILSFIFYERWAHCDGVLGTKKKCLYCWLEEMKMKVGLHCGYTKGKWVKKNG